MESQQEQDTQGLENEKSKEHDQIAPSPKTGTVEEQWQQALEKDDVKELFALFDQSKDRIKHNLLEKKQEEVIM